MSRLQASPVRTIRLVFQTDDGMAGKKVRSDLSCVAVTGDRVWLATDEGTRVERLTRTSADRYERHEPFDLAGLLRLPRGKDYEIDIEGLTVADGCLWLVGSHAHTRDKPDLESMNASEAIGRLANVDRNPNRCILARIPLDSLDGPEDQSAVPPAHMRASKKRQELLELIGDDPHLARFTSLPAKENGFDIEGLAVRGRQVFLGLRGPVLRGWAVILELCLDVQGRRLKPKRLARGTLRYRKHFLDLEGCGIRDLCFDGDDLLILAGPTMALDGAVRLHRWSPPAGTEHTMTREEHCPAIMEIPFRRGADRAEGIALVEGSDPTELVVVYDGPHPDRLHGGKDVDADVFLLPR